MRFVPHRILRTLAPLDSPIGGNDLLIAAHAPHMGCTLVTNNVEELRRVRGLDWESWIWPGARRRKPVEQLSSFVDEIERLNNSAPS